MASFRKRLRAFMSPDNTPGYKQAYLDGFNFGMEMGAWDSDDSKIWGAFPKESVRDDKTLWDRYEQAYFSSPLCSLLVDHVSAFLNNYKFVPGEEGTQDDVREVEEFFKLTNSYQKLQQLTLQSIILGTGVAQLVGSGERLDEEEGMQLIDVKTLTFRATVEEDGTYTEIIEQSGNELNIEDLLLIRLRRYPGRVGGVSMLTSTLFSIEALNELIEDVPAAIKHLAYVQKVAKINLEGYDTDAEKKTAVESFVKKFSRLNPAKSSLVAIDKENDLGYMGNVAGAGGGQSRMMPILDYVEPLIAWTMLNFNLGLGHILQTGANKALLESQESRIRVVMNQMRRNWAQQVQRQYIDKIAGENKVIIEHVDDAAELREEKKLALEEFNSGAISGEAYRKRFNIIDENIQDEDRATEAQGDDVNGSETQEESQEQESPEGRPSESGPRS